MHVVGLAWLAGHEREKEAATTSEGSSRSNNQSGKHGGSGHGGIRGKPCDEPMLGMHVTRA